MITSVRYAWPRIKFIMRRQHRDVKYHFLRSETRIKVKKVCTTDNLADMFTKSVPNSKFQHYLNLLNVRDCYLSFVGLVWGHQGPI